MKNINWETKKVKIKDLVQLDINPRKISDAKKKKLIESLQKFNLADIPTVNKDMTIIGGNQRVTALIALGREHEEIDVRMPNRQLNKNEIKEYALISNTHSGEWDFEMLELEFKDIIEINDFDIPGYNEANELGTITGNEEPDPEEYQPNNNWFLNIRCDNEAQAQKLYERFLEEGLDVKIIT